MQLKTLLFDLGNVLVHFCHYRMCRQIGALCNLSAADVRAELIDSSLQWQFERGQLSEREFHRQLEMRFQTTLPFTDLQQAAGDIFELNTSIVPVLDALKQHGVRLVLLSNTCITHYEWVRRQFDVLDRFDQLVLSYEVGAIKPEAAIYQAALTAIACEPHECLYVDDIPAYVAQGRAFGLDAELFTETPEFLTHLRQRQFLIERAI